MLLEPNLLNKVKELQNNVFYQNKLYSFDKEQIIVIETEINDIISEKPFGIDINTLKLLKSLKMATNVEYDEIRQTLIVDLASENGKLRKFKAKTIKSELPNITNAQFENEETEIDYARLLIAKKFVSAQIVKPMLTAVAVLRNGNLYATNAYKFYCYELNGTTKESDIALLPVLFIDSLDSTQEKIKINFNENFIYTAQENRKIYSRQISGASNYPLKALDMIVNGSCLGYLKFNNDEIRENIAIAKNVGFLDGNMDNKVIFNNGTLSVKGFNDFESEIENGENIDYFFALSLTNAKEMFDFAQDQEIQYSGDKKPLMFQIKGEKAIETFIYSPVIAN